MGETGIMTTKEKLMFKLPEFIKRTKELDDLMGAIAQVVDEYILNVENQHSECKVDNAIGSILTLLGYDYGETRFDTETEEQYRQRLKEIFEFKKHLGSMEAIRNILCYLKGVKAIEIMDRPNQDRWVMQDGNHGVLGYTALLGIDTYFAYVKIWFDSVQTTQQELADKIALIQNKIIPGYIDFSYLYANDDHLGL